jgi:hypothetical protein
MAGGAQIVGHALRVEMTAEPGPVTLQLDWSMRCLGRGCWAAGPSQAARALEAVWVVEELGAR